MQAHHEQNKQEKGNVNGIQHSENLIPNRCVFESS